MCPSHDGGGVLGAHWLGSAAARQTPDDCSDLTSPVGKTNIGDSGVETDYVWSLNSDSAVIIKPRMEEPVSGGYYAVPSDVKLQ